VEQPDDDDFCPWCGAGLDDCLSDACEDRLQWRLAEYEEERLL
jgi:hypothetical protein